MSFTVPLNGCTIVATATVVTLCSSMADCPGSAAPMCCGGVCVAMSCGGGGFTPHGAYDSVWESVSPLTGKYFLQLFPVPRGRWVCWHAEWLVHDTPVFRVHSSSCGAQCGVVHSPFEWLDHRCHCNCRQTCAAGVFASRCRVVVDFSLLVVLTILFGTV